MADQTFAKRLYGQGVGILNRLRDLGDGAHAEVMALELGPQTATVTTVASGIASVEILAANANRRGAIIHNTDANALSLLLAAGTASASNLTVQVASDTSYEVPYGYRGVINGIWAADGTGSAVVTELT